MQLLHYPFIFSKLFAIISGEGMHTVRNWQEQVNQGFAHLVGSTSHNFTQQKEARFAFCQGDTGLMMHIADHSVHFPIADTLALMDELGVEPDGETILLFQHIKRQAQVASGSAGELAPTKVR